MQLVVWKKWMSAYKRWIENGYHGSLVFVCRWISEAWQVLLVWQERLPAYERWIENGFHGKPSHRSSSCARRTVGASFSCVYLLVNILSLNHLSCWGLIIMCRLPDGLPPPRIWFDQDHCPWMFVLSGSDLVSPFVVFEMDFPHLFSFFIFPQMCMSCLLLIFALDSSAQILLSQCPARSDLLLLCAVSTTLSLPSMQRPLFFLDCFRNVTCQKHRSYIWCFLHVQKECSDWQRWSSLREHRHCSLWKW